MPVRPPPLPALRAFAALARFGSVGAAAEELHVTHGAVSHQIRALEEHLGVPLISRGGRKIALTEEGRIYAYQVRQALDDIAGATERLQARREAGQLTISLLPSFAMYWLVPRLPGFAAQCPDLRLNLSATMAFVDFDNELTDCAIRFGHGNWPDLHCEWLMSDSLLMVASPGFNQGMLPQTCEQLIAAPLLHASESWATWLSAAGIEQARPASRFEFTDSTHMIEAARLGLGIALTRRSIAQDLIERGELVQVTAIEATHPTSNYYLVWPHRMHQAASIQRLLSWLRGEVSVYRRSLQ